MIKVYVPCDSSALSLGADRTAKAIVAKWFARIILARADG
jgi:hypothetical protein